MPYHVGSDSSCPASKPHAVIKDSDGEVMGCHATEDDAKDQIAALHASEEKQMAQTGTVVEAVPDRGHLLLKATTVAMDQGIFEAVISTATIDREKDIVEPQAMVDALQKWVAVGKLLPLLWQHSTAPEDHIGHIDPASARAEQGEVLVKGWIDQATERGAEVWRLVKSGTLGFSFGYLTLQATERKGGGNHISELDVFEATATSTPMNGDTRVVGWKSIEAIQKELDDVRVELAEANKTIDDLKEKADETDRQPVAGSVDPLRKQLDDLELEFATSGLDGLKPPPVEVKEVEVDQPSLDDLQRHCHDLMLELLSEGLETT